MNTATRHPAAKPAAPKPKPRSGLENWEDGIDKADENWDAYDCEIRSAVGEYDRHLSRTPGHVPLDWRIIKAMLWVETGAKVVDWRVKPMQIGNDGDPGMMALLGDREGGELIIPPSLRAGLSVSTAGYTGQQHPCRHRLPADAHGQLRVQNRAGCRHQDLRGDRPGR